MISLPILLLLFGALAGWIFRESKARIQWALQLATVFSCWLAALLLVSSMPSSLQLSVWQPTDLFISRLELRFDQIGWSLLYAIATSVFAISLTGTARPFTESLSTRLATLIYAAIAMLGVLAGNLLTVATIWVLMDLWTAFILLRLVDNDRTANRFFTRLTIDGVGVVLVIAAYLVEITAGGNVSLDDSMSSPSAAVLLTLACLVRLGLMPLHFASSPVKRVQLGLGTLIRFLPPAVALSVLARILAAGIPSTALPWLTIAGVLGMAVGGLRWAFQSDPIQARPYLVMAASGLGIGLASISPFGDDLILATGVLLILMGSVISLSEIYTPVFRIWLFAAGATLLGMPGTPGGVIVGTLWRDGFSEGRWLIAALGTLSVISLGLGTLRMLGKQLNPWPTGESLTHILYGLGLALPVFVALGIGIQIGGAIDLPSVLMFFVTFIIGLTAYFGLRRLPQRETDRWQRMAIWIDPEPVYRAFGSVNRMIMSALRTVGDLLEGEGAMLWLFVILMLLILGI